MKFMQTEYIIPVIITVLILIFSFYKIEKKFFQWVYVHWFFKRSFTNKISSVFYFIGFFVLSLALLDLRGPEKNITGKVSDQKTMILIDSSTSMLAEDVRPNRFSKAVLLAKHYVKKAVGQQISIIVFSDGQKRIVPFTNDIDLLDARLNSLENLELKRGGTGLSLAIQESIQYFKVDAKSGVGNILIFTDAEETETFDLNIPDDVTVGIVGIGTAKGGPIPLRNKSNVFTGNKKYKGKVVISKLDEGFLKKIGNKIKDYKFWIASSYSLPTEQIVRFFSKTHKIKMSKNNFRIRPVLANYLLVPGILLLIMAFIFKNMKSFVYVGILLVTFNSYGQQPQQEEKEPEKSTQTLQLEGALAEGKLDKSGKKKLATQLLKDGFPEQSSVLYNEVLDKKINESNKNDYFNMGASQLKEQKIGQGVQTYTKLYDYLKNSEKEEDKKLFENVKKNIIKAIQSSAGKKGGKSKEDKENKGDNKDNKSGEGQSSQRDSDGKKKDQKNKKGEGEQDKKDKDKKDKDEKGKDKKDKDKDKKDKDGKDKDKKNKDKDGKDKDKNNKDKDKQKNQDGKGGKKKKKLPAILKQLMSDDNQLQKKMIDAETTKRKSREKRDW